MLFRSETELRGVLLGPGAGLLGHRHTAAWPCVTTSVPVVNRGHSGVRRVEEGPHVDHTRSQGRGEAGQADTGLPLLRAQV